MTVSPPVRCSATVRRLQDNDYPYQLARKRNTPCPHIRIRGRLAFGVVEPAGAPVPDGEGLEVVELGSASLWDPEELEEAELGGSPEPEGDAPALVPGSELLTSIALARLEMTKIALPPINDRYSILCHMMGTTLSRFRDYHYQKSACF
jgi:hypothetical protein